MNKDEVLFWAMIMMALLMAWLVVWGGIGGIDTV